MHKQAGLTAVEQAPTLTRSTFLKIMSGATLGLTARLGVFGAGLFMGAPVFAADVDVEVFPTGTFPLDIDEVSSAINGGVGPSGISYPGGGTVLLKATNREGIPTAFNFGDGAWPATRGSVPIQKDVVILGEKNKPAPQNLPFDAERDAGYMPNRTVIFGGKRPFNCPSENPTATRLTVRGLYFAYPSLAAVQVKKSAGLVVTDCVIYDVKSDVTDAPAQLPYAALGVEATGLTQTNPVLMGEFRVEDNRIWRRPPTSGFYAADVGIALQLASMVPEIRRNDVRGFAFAGIGIDRNTQAGIMSDNRVARCGYGPAAISGGLGTRGMTVSTIIARNEVECGEHGPSQWTRNGISIVGSSNVLLSSNIVGGDVAVAGISLTNASSNCAMHGNRLKNLTAGMTQVQVLEGSQSNLLTSNEYGGVGTAGICGALVRGQNNQLVDERFWGSYLGHAQPCVWLTTTSSGNRVSQLKYGSPAVWAVCTQVRDEGFGNIVEGIERCSRK
jgi:hypothetical protein